jgi:hypothetical protein
MALLRRVMPPMRAAGNFQWDDDTYPNETVFTNDIAQNQCWLAEIDGQLAGISAITPIRNRSTPTWAGTLPSWLS